MKQEKILSRINRIEGQLKGIYAMIENKSDLNSVVQQIEAVKGALTSVEELILLQNFNKIAKDKPADQYLKQTISYLLKR